MTGTTVSLFLNLTGCKILLRYRGGQNFLSVHGLIVLFEYKKNRAK